MPFLRRDSWEHRWKATVCADLEEVVNWYAAPQRLDDYASTIRQRGPEYFQTSTYEENGYRVWECRWRRSGGPMATLREETLLGPNGVAIPTEEGCLIESELTGQAPFTGDNRPKARYRSITHFKEIAEGAVEVSVRQTQRIGDGSRWDRIIPPVAERASFRRAVEQMARRCQDGLAKRRSS